MPVVKSSEAFVTLVTNSDYGLGAAVLGHRLRTFGTKLSTVVMVTDSVSSSTREMLANNWDSVVDITQLDSNDAEKLAMMKRPELGVTFSKLNVWKLVQFTKVVFLDADTMPLCNIDELFAYEELSACRDAGWPDCFNTGLFVLRPSIETYNQLVQKAAEEGSFDGGDQGLLNTFFKTWSYGDISKHIPFTFNVNPNASYTYLPAYKAFADQVKMVHFLGAIKPWHYQFCQGQVLAQNVSEHTLKFLLEWNNTAEVVKGAASSPSESRVIVSETNVQQNIAVSADTDTGNQGSEPTARDSDLLDVMSHISTQIRAKEQSKSCKY